MVGVSLLFSLPDMTPCKTPFPRAETVQGRGERDHHMRLHPNARPALRVSARKGPEKCLQRGLLELEAPRPQQPDRTQGLRFDGPYQRLYQGQSQFGRGEIRLHRDGYGAIDVRASIDRWQFRRIVERGQRSLGPTFSGSLHEVSSR